MRLATCDYDAAVCRVEVHTKHRLVGALKAEEMLSLHVHMQDSVNILVLNSLSLQPVCPLSASPRQKGRGRWSHRRHTVCFLHSEGKKQPYSHMFRAKVSCLAVSVLFPYRLGESQADQGSVKEAGAQNMEGVEADRVPHTDMRSQMLSCGKRKPNPKLEIQDVCHSETTVTEQKPRKKVIKCQCHSYFSIWSRACYLSGCYGDLIRMDSKAGEEEDWENAHEIGKRLYTSKGARE